MKHFKSVIAYNEAVDEGSILDGEQYEIESLGEVLVLTHYDSQVVSNADICVADVICGVIKQTGEMAKLSYGESDLSEGSLNGHYITDSIDMMQAANTISPKSV